MLIFTQVLQSPLSDGGLPDLVLDHEQRRHSRLRTVLADGTVVGFALPRGTVLRHGDVLVTEGRRWSKVRAAAERLSVVSCQDSLRLARAAYHLGNRHVALQLEPNALYYPSDPLLDSLCSELGLSVCIQYTAPCMPRPGIPPARLAARARNPSQIHERLDGNRLTAVGAAPR